MKNTARLNSWPHSSVNSTLCLAGVLEAGLHRQSGHERRDEHARSEGFGRQQAQQRQRHHAKLPPRIRQPPAAVRHAQQPAAQSAKTRADEYAVTELFAR